MFFTRRRRQTQPGINERVALRLNSLPALDCGSRDFQTCVLCSTESYLENQSKTARAISILHAPDFRIALTRRGNA
jgi:hypothetical protein